MGIIYKSIGNYDKSLEFYMRSYEIDKDLGDKGSLGGTLHNIGGLYQDKGEYDKAFYDEKIILFTCMNFIFTCLLWRKV